MDTRKHMHGYTHTHIHTHTHCPSVFVSLPLPSPWVCLQKNVMLCTTRMLSAPHTEHFPWNHHMHCRFLCIMNIWNPSGEGKVSRWVHDPRNWSTNKNIRVYLAGNIEIHLVLLCQPPKLDQEAGCSRLQLARWGITVNCIREGHLRFDSETLPPIGDNCASQKNGCQDKSLTFSSYLFWSCLFLLFLLFYPYFFNNYCQQIPLNIVLWILSIQLPQAVCCTQSKAHLPK